MLSTKLIRMLTLGLALAAPAAMAGDTASKLNCPAGTAQAGTKDEGFTCVKANAKAGTQLAHGAYVEYHPNGKLATQGQFSDGLKVGVWTFYDESGNKRSTAEFKSGGWDGQRVMYFPSGKPRLIEEYQNGRKNGLVKELAEDGRVVSQVRYENNRAVANE
ncbi:toxin-antitoxin system YwqK family antitoxin [Pyxidicoccus trucidator]|uniref:toxin-antitoxin system YwqK family antitoxin n=1 Tax=Pyxidicoccus trucidator TaxID=2709662 RepID=UPI0013DD254E|nr:toxin-antitoxin system YwqK family antitoxin [Pyxidicoccus trucidator]